MTPSDTLVCDTAQLARFQHDEAFNYSRELMAQEDTLMEYLTHKLSEMLSVVFGSSAHMLLSRPVLFLIGFALMAVVLWFLYRNRPELFSRRGRAVVPYELEQETIYGIDFDAAVRQALDRGDYRMAVRYTYLKTLRHLSDTGRVDWQLYKTPSQYVREYRPAAFRRLTDHFLRIRYGNFEASAAVYAEVEGLAAGILSAHDDVPPQAKGGEP